MNGQGPDGSQKAVQFPLRLFGVHYRDVEKFELDGHLLDPCMLCLTGDHRRLQLIITGDKAGSACGLMRRH